jgi:hypothetical protein
MALLHQIRLQGPWEVVPPGESAAREAWIPAPWRALFGEQFGTALYRRNFNRPTGLEPDDQVRIRLPELAGEVMTVMLNSVTLACAPDELLAFDATGALQDFNRLEIAFRAAANAVPDHAGGLWEPALLEIHGAKKS